MTDAAAETHPTRVSVIIPTHNRRRLLRQALDGLAEQALDEAELEVVVVADGCEDDTLAMLAERQAPFRLVVLSQPAGGAAAARNAGAAAASGALLIFLDDDIQPARGLVSAHLAAHAASPGAVVLGAYPPAPHASASLFRLFLRNWWTTHFATLAEPGHRFTYRDLLTGNLSLPARLWREFGGLDPQFRNSREDYEFGVRLLAAGVPFVYAPQALGWHHEHETMSLQGAFRRAYDEGRMDALMGEKHPQIRPTLPLAQPRRRRRRWVERLIRGAGRGLDPAARAVSWALPSIDRAGLRRLYARLFNGLRTYWYVRGVGEHFGSYRAWVKATKAPLDRPAAPAVTLDLSVGVDRAAARLDAERPSCARLCFGRHVVGLLPFEAGAEPWRGGHLAPHILRHLQPAFLKALALEGEILPDPRGRREALARAVEAATRRPPHPDPLNIWEEQQEQWNRLQEPARPLPSPSPRESIPVG